jgi:predicted unusual protein kinase regulating ubiquinone biosynthesis (AarF/ABC1/UbiB family)
LLRDGFFFKADPHPEIWLSVKMEGLFFYDFGMMAEVQSINQDQMIRNVLYRVEERHRTSNFALTDMGLVESMTDMTPVRQLLSFTLERFYRKADRSSNSKVYAMMYQPI